MERSAIRGLTLGSQTRPRISLRSIRATRRRASSPRVHFGHRASRPSCPFCSERACGTRGKKPLPRPPASQAGIPHTVRENNGTRAVVQLKRVRSFEPNRGLGSSFSLAFRTRMDLSACWMSRGLELVPPPPVRANCRPDMHSSRPLPLPSSAPNAFWIKDPQDIRGPSKFADLRVPFHAAKTIAACSVWVRDALMIVVLSLTSRTK